MSFDPDDILYGSSLLPSVVVIGGISYLWGTSCLEPSSVRSSLPRNGTVSTLKYVKTT